MKRFLIFIGCLIGFSAYGECVSQPQSLGVVTVSTTTFTGPFAPSPRTLAQINALTPGVTNQIVVCTDCTRTALCISSGILRGAWVVPVSTAAFPSYTTLHCQ